MLNNLEKSRGVVFSQGLLLKLVEKGLTREAAYALVQEAAKKVWDEGVVSLREAVVNDPAILKHLSLKEAESVFDYAYHLKNVNKIFDRVGIPAKKQQVKKKKTMAKA